MKRIEFPIANVSNKNWDKNDDYLLYLLFDPYIYRTNKSFYNKYFFNNFFVDSNGNVFKITDRILPSKVKQFFSFLPNLCKIELVFEDTGRTIAIEEIRNHIIKQLEQLDEYEYKDSWIENVKKAKTIKDIIFGDEEDAGG